MQDDSSIAVLRCRTCGETYPLTERFFYRAPSYLTGFNSLCRACTSAKVSEGSRQKMLAEMLAPNGQKRCRKCLRYWPDTSDHFYASGKPGNRLVATCRACLSKTDEGRRKLLLKMQAPPGMRACNKCERYIESTLENFRPNKKSRDGLRFDCRECARTDEVRRRSEDPTYIERHRESQRLARQRNPERYRVYRDARKAKLRGAAGFYDEFEVVQMYDDQQGLCAYCDSPLFGTYDIDHMHPLSRGGRNDWTNLAIACQRCNRRKRAKTAAEFMEWRKRHGLTQGAA